MNDIPEQEFTIYNEISNLAGALWSESTKIEGSNRDPKMFSIMLFKRLWSNHRGYTLLHNNSLSLEADIVLRSGIEAAICIAANYHLRDEFLVLMRRDVAFTLQGQIKIHREAGASDLVKDEEAELRRLRSLLPEGKKPARLDWKALAQEGQTPQLYDFYRTLSGVSSHVTGMSVLKGVVFDERSANAQDEFYKTSRRLHLMMMAGATLQGSMVHAVMIDEASYINTAKALIDRMNEISKVWLKA